MNVDSQTVSLLRGEIIQIISGTFFVGLGLLALIIAVIRRGSGVRVLVWLGLWSGMFGAQEFLRCRSVAAALPASFQPTSQLLIALFGYTVLVVGVLSFAELSKGALLLFQKICVVAAVVVAIAGLAKFLHSGVVDAYRNANNAIAAIASTVLVIVVAVPALSRRYMVVSGHRVLTVGTLIFASQALYSNAANILTLPRPGITSELGFAALLLSLGYTAMTMIVGNENRLLAIDKELQIARELQFSILPASPPEVEGLHIAAIYEPMTAVAGDFYEFIKVDERGIGILVADVSGHGVPAALIASMIKVAAQSVNGNAADPSQVIRRLGNILSDHLRGQFVSAAYLCIDPETRVARYSAAGHPPLLHWRSKESSLKRIESNGLLFGVLPDCEYPSCEIPLVSGDMFLLYTDGVTEPENAMGEAFGDNRLEQIVRESRSFEAVELSSRLVQGVRQWQATPAALDDMTLVIIGVD